MEWNLLLVKSLWTSEEDAFILRWIKDYGVGYWIKFVCLLLGYIG